MAYRQARFPGARRILAQDAVGRYDLRRTLMARMLAEQPTLSLLLLHGDVELESLDLDPRAPAEPNAGALARAEPDVHGLIVAGNLTVHGSVHHSRSPMGLSLYVLGSLRAANIAVSGLELVVRGSVQVDEVIAGAGPQGGARLDGGVAARLLISDGFPMLIGGRLAAPVLDTRRTRIGLVEGTGVAEAMGDVPPAVVLADSVRSPDSEGGRFSFDRLRATMAAGRSALSADYRSGENFAGWNANSTPPWVRAATRWPPTTCVLHANAGRPGPRTRCGWPMPSIAPTTAMVTARRCAKPWTCSTKPSVQSRIPRSWSHTRRHWSSVRQSCCSCTSMTTRRSNRPGATAVSPH